MAKVIVIPDLHEPFAHKDALAFVCKMRDAYQCDETVLLGDEADFHAISNYTPDADGMGPGQELDAAVENLKARWYKEFPVARVCRSNHTDRPWRKMQANGLPRRLQPKIHAVLQAPETWEWADHWKVDGVIYEHGDSVSGGQYPYAIAAMRNMERTVIGHHHGAFGLHWHRTPHRTIFGMGVGWLGDEHTYAMKYGGHWKKKPILGCAVVLNGEPLLVRMVTDKKNRWHGKVEYIGGLERK